MMTIEQLKKRLENMNLAAVSADSGVSYSVIYRISKGLDSVGYSSVKALSDYFEGKDHAKT
jgi:predicted transcriptional regulator